MNKRLFLLLLVPVVGLGFYLRSLASWRPQKLLVVPGSIDRLVFSNDGKTLLVQHRPSPSAGGGPQLGKPQTAIALDAGHGFNLLWKREDDFWGDSRFFDNDSKVFTDDATVHIFDAHTGKMLQHKEALGYYDISSDGKWLAYNPASALPGYEAQEGRIYLNPVQTKRNQRWHVSGEKVIGQKSDYAPAPVFSPDSSTLAVSVGVKDAVHLRFYSTKTWKLTRTWVDVCPSPPERRPSYHDIQWSRDGQYILTTLGQGGEEMGRVVWRVRDGKKLTPLTNIGASTSADDPVFVHIENGGDVLYGSGGRVLRSKPPLLIKNSETLFSIPNESMKAAAISPDGSYLVAGTQSGKVYRKRLK